MQGSAFGMTSPLEPFLYEHMNDEIFFMREALREAKTAEKENEVPIGCVIVKNSKIISRAHNQTIKKNDPIAHAEILAIKKAARKTKNYRLINCLMYVTIEPCPMCAGALVWARISKVIYGAADKKAGSCESVLSIVHNKRFNHRVEIKRGVLQKACADLVKRFFKKRR